VREAPIRPGLGVAGVMPYEVATLLIVLWCLLAGVVCSPELRRWRAGRRLVRETERELEKQQ
jgi:hypothetical protein